MSEDIFAVIDNSFVISTKRFHEISQEKYKETIEEIALIVSAFDGICKYTIQYDMNNNIVCVFFQNKNNNIKIGMDLLDKCINFNLTLSIALYISNFR